jgi:23S rRNA-/tRNA-specific pseudouridylate synthase
MRFVRSYCHTQEQCADRTLVAMMSLLGRPAPLSAAASALARPLATSAPVATPPPPTALRLLYGDAALLVVDKPPGLLSVPGRTPRSLVANAHTLLAGWALQRQPADAARLLACPSAFTAVEQLRAAEAQLAALESATDAAASVDNDASAPPAPTRYGALRRGRLRWTVDAASSPYPAPLGLHRLDEATSGLLAFALTYPVQRALALQLQPGGAARKVYEAVVDTRAAEAAAALAAVGGGATSPLMAADEGEIDTPPRRHNHLPLLQVRDGDGVDNGANDDVSGVPFSTSARPCVTRWRVLARGAGAVRLELTPLTGRTHQLRLHCALPPPYGLGAPILGDSFYGDPALAESPYLLELLGRAAQRRQEQRQHGEGVATAVGADAFATSAELLAREHATRSALLARAGWAHRMPALDGCAYLPPHGGSTSSGSGAAASAPLRPVPRLLLHARELHIADGFSHADRVLTRARWAAEGGAPRTGSPRYRRPGGGSDGAPAAAVADGGNDDRDGAAAAVVGDSPAVATARCAGAELWAQAEPWTVEDTTLEAVEAVAATANGAPPPPPSSPFVRRYAVASEDGLQRSAASRGDDSSQAPIRGKRRSQAPPPPTAFVAFVSPTPF